MAKQYRYLNKLLNDNLTAAKQATTPTARKQFLREAKFARVRLNILQCESCPLHQSRTRAVPYDFDTANWPAKIALVGEAPGRNEDEQGIPFVGRSGNLLNKLLADVGLTRPEVFICNTINCRPPDNRDPTAEEHAACSNHLSAQLSISGAWVVVLLGKSAAKAINAPKSALSSSMTPFWMDKRLYFPTYHPAYALRGAKGAKQAIRSTLQAALDVARHQSAWPSIPVSEANLSDLRPTVNIRKLRRLLKQRSWAVVYSKALEDELVIVTDDFDSVAFKDIESEYGNHPFYTTDEILMIGEMVREEGGWTRENLKQLHVAKTMLKGTLVLNRMNEITEVNEVTNA